MAADGVSKSHLSEGHVPVEHIAQHAADWQMLGILFSEKTHHALGDIHRSQGVAASAVDHVKPLTLVG